LEKLGVVLGDRRKMLRAIAKLETHKSADIVTVATAAPAGPSLLDTSAAKSRLCSLTLWARRHYPPAWTLKTSAKLSRSTRRASPRPYGASAGS
jgi:hypothetical protein